jgi:hypothetical protein
LLPASIVIEWVLDMSAVICSAYLELVTLQLSTVQRTYSFLQKMKKQTPTSTVVSSSGSEGMNDADKVALQLYFDVRFFGQSLSNMGVTLSTFEPWTKLWNTVKFAEKVHASFMICLSIPQIVLTSLL